MTYEYADLPSAPKPKLNAYAEGVEKGKAARATGKYSPATVTQFINANRHEKDGFTRGFIEGLQS